jgi:uncharacterized protein YggE
VNKLHFTVPALVLATLVVPSALPFASRPAAASESVSADSPPDDNRDSVQVTGTGAVFGVPDVLTADFGVEADASTVDKAMDRANTAATRMRDTLLRSGVVTTDLRTSNVGIDPNRNDHNTITGYTVSQGLTAKIHNLPQAGALISAAIAAGGDVARLNDVSFSIEDEADLLAEARRKAFTDAHGKADLYARAAGRSLGRVVKIIDETPTYGSSFGQNDMAGVGSAGGSIGTKVPIEPGRQQVTVTVTVEWAFTPPGRPGPARSIASDLAADCRQGGHVGGRRHRPDRCR